ncbi:isochorismate synthase MenF [Virgibacillus sp. SK37]|uniref:isochorismate synthase n=1 Tax=Virgibacillus sp. SK37 TaxID=403957 RepID=UPI0004D0B048|nr:isochorismate synthase [Virgibacillus sp. SK37]AIF44000.1 isochorismate synthase [Virgibacillus sp. SK37]
MIEIMEEQLEKIIDEAIPNINTADDYQLISITKQVNKINPLHFFHAASYTKRDRVFWSSTQDNFFIVGVGNAAQLRVEGLSSRNVEKKWRELLNKAIIYNDSKVDGAGIVALGGMSFDPKKERTPLWKNFSDSQFTVPEFLLTQNNGASYYTINILVRKGDHAEEVANEIRSMEEILFSKTALPVTDVTIMNRYEVAPEKWKEAVELATREIGKGSASKIVLAREIRLKLNKSVNIASVLEKLLHTQPNSYIFAFEKGEDCFVGATPERLVKLNKRELLSTCLAGTAPRGKNKKEDKEISENLLHDEKNRQEHEFVVQMIKQAISHYCKDINIPEKPVIYPLKNLQHLYTPVTATLMGHHSIFDIIEQLHPTPALGGTPREESLAFIRENELLDRGWYGAPVGWLDSNGSGEFAVAIRSGLIQDDEASLFAGCGVVKNSDPEKEYEETNIKFLPMLSVLGG